MPVPSINGRIWLGSLVCAAQGTGGIDGRTRVQKLVFLGQHRSDQRAFRFRAGHAGPYSRELDSALDQLITTGFIAEREVTTDDGLIHYVYAATDETREWLAERDERLSGQGLAELVAVVNEHAETSLLDLLDVVAEEAPQMARNMEVR